MPTNTAPYQHVEYCNGQLDLTVIVYHDHNEEVFCTTYLHRDATPTDIFEHLNILCESYAVSAVIRL